MVWESRSTKPFSHPFLSSSSPATLLFSASVLLVFSGCIITTTTEAAISLPKNVTISAVIVFGDSIVDQGNNNDIETLVKCNFPPYGKDFMGGKPTGRFTNGKTPADMMGQRRAGGGDGFEIDRGGRWSSGLRRSGGGTSKMGLGKEPPPLSAAEEAAVVAVVGVLGVRTEKEAEEQKEERGEREKEGRGTGLF
ncbi:hypothetical protein RHMOL_Rhmol06G0026400 [Rhododendron molle]|uniref:Uncharacterized protein n=1 Tax=Rhododendron molle TaxID=49168 RepID=A0ACC0N898_RHOML|nr:hypothetical protein RHMOL_Rhmol06G0026400 [Rhododendron molle]